MKSLLQKVKISAFASVLIAVSVISGCSKEKTLNPIKMQSASTLQEQPPVVGIEELKKYFASVIKADEKLVTYDEKTQQIVFRGVNQIDRETLTKIYLVNHKSNN